MIASMLSRAGILVFICLLLSGRVAAQSSTPAPNEPAEIDLKFRDDSLDQMLSLLQRFTGKTVLRPQQLPTSMYTITSQKLLTRTEAITAIETLLTMNQVGVSALGDKFLRVVPLGSVRTESPPFIEGSTLGMVPTGDVASKLFQLTFMRPTEVQGVIQPILNQYVGGFTAFEKAGAILITDTIANLQRVETLLAHIDQPNASGVGAKYYAIHNTKASDLVTKLHSFFSTPALQAQFGTASLNADDRTNQIILIADQRQFASFDDLISKLDTKSDPNTRNDVIYLRHAASKDVATLLTTLIQGQNTATRSLGGGPTTPSRPTNTPAPGQPAPAGPTASAFNSAVENSNYTFSTLMTVLSDDRSNALVVSGTVDDIRLISELVKKIDTPLPQVRIEVVICEVSLNDDNTTGLDALGLTVRNGQVIAANATLPGLAITNGILKGSGALGGQFDFSNARTKSNVSILNTQNTVVSHAKKAHFFVGEQRPTIGSFTNTGQTSSTGTASYASGLQNSITQQKIGTIMDITPLIGDDGSIQLDITQEVDQLNGTVSINGTDSPIVAQRISQTFMTAKSGEIRVMSGLSGRQDTANENRLGVIGQIPIIGWLFGSHEKIKNRTDLIFFVKPTVLTNTPEDNAESLQRVNELPDKNNILKAIGQPTTTSSKTVSPEAPLTIHHP